MDRWCSTTASRRKSSLARATRAAPPRTMPALPIHSAKVRKIERLFCKVEAESPRASQSLANASTCFPRRLVTASIRNLSSWSRLKPAYSTSAPCPGWRSSPPRHRVGRRCALSARLRATPSIHRWPRQVCRRRRDFSSCHPLSSDAHRCQYAGRFRRPERLPRHNLSVYVPSRMLFPVIPGSRSDPRPGSQPRFRVLGGFWVTTLRTSSAW